MASSSHEIPNGQGEKRGSGSNGTFQRSPRQRLSVNSAEPGNLQLPVGAIPPSRWEALTSPISQGGGTTSHKSHVSLVSSPGSDAFRSGAASVSSCVSMSSDIFFQARTQTILIFDWDDTLCPSSYLKRHDVKVLDDSVPEEYIPQLTALAKSVKEVLELSRNLGETIIVTNAEQGWVELSCSKWFPEILGFIKTFRILSARSLFEPQGVTSPCGWKANAFRSAIDSFYSRYLHQSWKNVISIGDSPHEREALIRVTLGQVAHPNCRVKTVEEQFKNKIMQFKPSCNIKYKF